ncbi:hypothetical protein BDV18DRAFT_158968 [Aspergillus unguis]
MKLSTISSIATLLASATAAEWSMTNYVYKGKCDVDSDGTYRVYFGEDNKCHQFGPGDSGASCRQFTDGGSHWTDDCDDEINTSASVLIRHANCKVFQNDDCTGDMKTGGELDCVTGAFRSFLCNY